MISFLQLADGAPANRYGKPVGRPARSGMRAKPGPATISINRGILARRLDAELAERDALLDPCLEAVDTVEAIRTKLREALRADRPAIQARLDAAINAKMLAGARVLAVEARIKLTRAELRTA